MNLMEKKNIVVKTNVNKGLSSDLSSCTVFIILFSWSLYLITHSIVILT